MPVNYIDPWEGRVPSLKDSSSSSATDEDKNSSSAGDFVDAFQEGMYQSAAGDAEAIGQISDSDTFKSIGKALARGADNQTATMTDEGRQALSQHIFKDDPDSFTGVAFDDGATNWRTWALQFGVLGGQVAGTLATGFGAGSVVKAGAKTAIKAFAKEAVTKEAQQLVAKNAVKEAIRNGALDDVRAALIAAPDKAAINAVLNKATSRLGGIATTAVAGSMAAGMRAQQARDEYLGLDADTLNQNPEFQKAYWEIADNPENQGLDTATIHNAAKEMLAEKAATTAFFDKKALLSDLASGAYVPGAGGVIGRGAATASKMGRFGIGLAQEGATEAWQGGETQRAVNEALKEWGDESRDPMANVVRTRWEEGTLGGVFGGMAKVAEGQHQAPTKPIVTVDNSPSTGNSNLDSALAQSNADEQSRYDTLTGHVDELSKPAYMRNGDISPALENAIAQFRLDAIQQQQAQQRKDGIMQPLDNQITGNPDEPAFLRSSAFNPTGRDIAGAPDVDPNTPVQQALARSVSDDNSIESQLADVMAKGDQGKTPQEDFVTGEWLRWDQRQPISKPSRIESGVTMPGESREILPESRGLGYNNQINMPGKSGNGINDNYVPPVTTDRVTADQSLDVESTRDPRSPVAQSIDNAGQQSDAIFNELKSLRVTRRGKPFGSVKEAQLASRPTETPIELPTGGFGIVDKAELEQAQANQAPTATITNDGTKSDKVIDQASLNDNGDNRESPWLFADGKVVSSNGDHISLSDEYGYSGYRDMSKGTGAIRSTFYKPRNSTDEQTPFVSLQLFDDQKLTPEQFKSVESFVKANDAKITLGVDRSGNNTDNVEKNEVSLDELKDKYTADQAVVAKESQPQPAMTQEEKEDSDIKAFTDTGKSDIPDSNYLGQAVGLLRMSEGLNHLPGNRSRVINAMANSLTSPAAKDYLIKLVKVYGFDAGFIQEDSKAAIQANTKPKENKKSPEQTQTNPDLADKSLEDLISLRNQTKAEHQNRADAISANAKLYPDDVNEARELEALNQRYSDKFNQIDSAIAKKRAESASESAQTTPDNPQIIEHTTGKNKVIRGVVRTDLTVDEAKAIDPYTFKKDGGYFIREKHLDKLPPVKASTEPAKVESQPEQEVTTAQNEILSTANGKPTETVQEQSVKPSKEQFADNKLFTADRVAAARARLKSKMGNLNSGLDPEIMIDGMTIAGAYIESGLRTFSAYAKAMTEDFGDKVKPYLLSFWEGARHYPGLDTAGMTSADESAKQHAALMRGETESAAKPAEKTQQKSSQEANDKAGTERQILRDGIHSKMANGELISNNNTLKRVAAELLGISTSDLSTTQLKEAQEAYEVAAVRHRRDTIISTFNEGGSVKVAFDLAVADYEAQPNMDVRTAKSSDMQAYSTPTPMALLANIAAGAWSGKTVFEPTAGNGLLLLTADSKTTYANELDPDRADSLAWSGFNVTVKDATNNPFEGMVPEKVDAVVANPPFGKYRDEAGKPTKVEFMDNQGRAYAFGEIDHIIAKNALDAMKDDGSATLILGAPKEAGDYTGNNKVFLNWLYSNYNVVHHVEADGDLYKGQGAGWPTQMIVVHGRAKDGTGKFAPFKGEIERLNSWDAIYDSFNKQGLLDTQGAVFSQTTGNGNLHQGYEPVTDLSASQRVSNRGSGVDDLGNGRLGAGKSGRATGNSRSRKLGNGESPVGTFDSQPDLSRHELEPTESQSTTNTGNTKSDKRPDRVGLSGQRNGDAVADYQKKEISSSVKKVNDFQAEYQTASEGFNDGVLTPVNMASYTQTALASIQDRHGSIDKFVADRLGYKSKQELQKAFMGLQADAVALAVDAIEKGRAIIIGDQTGVGKGRQAAGVIRYALQQTKTPIFITQKPNLFTDMYDDLADIGVKDFKPLIVNQENGFISKGDKKLFDMSAKERQSALNHILKTGKLPDGYNALFLTYSQISSDKNGNKVGLISRLAENAVMVMDESHTAAGQDSKLGLAFQELVNNVHGLVYLSATYAKRPDNMLLYTRTDLGHAVENREALVSIISNGGLGMQTYIAGKLAEAGQMVRRERSFDGISIKNEIINDKSGEIRKGFDQATTALRAIQDLSAAWREYVETALAKQIQEESGMDTAIAGNQADTKVDVTLFSSIVHNYIAQLSLGLKAKETARLAIEAIGRGERPVIALENTMGSALDDYMVRTGRRIGDSASDLTYSSLLKSVADGSLAYLVKEAGAKKGEKTYVNIKDIHDPLIQSLYSQVMDAADAMKMDIPASPIDAIRHEIEKAGYSVAEITGRDLMVDYANGSEIKNRPAAEKNRRRIVDEFNSKKLDVLILNQAGSTGLSLHASERFADKSPRHMIVAQPSLDINTFLQMLGRVNRTGQVVTPSYSLAWLDLPSEKRPAAVLSRKMSSLNANTSGNTDSATSIDAVDILNPYGDQVVTNFVEANLELLEQYNPRLVKLPDGDEAAYFLGKLAVLPSDVAEQVLGQIEKDYNDLIAYLDATGQNELNISEVDLDAQPISQRIVSEGRKGAGVFSEPTYVTKVDVKAQGKAPRWDEVEEALKESSQSEFDDAVNRMKADNGFAERLQERLNKAQKEFDLRKAEGKTTKTEAEKVESLKQMISSHEAEKNNLEYLFSRRGMYHHGAVLRVRLPDADEAITGIVTGLSFENDGGNPAAKSKWRMKIMVADRVRTLPINLSQAESGIIEGGRQDNRYNLQAIFDRASAMPSREHRYIMTGNLVEAQNCSMEKGRIIPFTTADGRVIQGMLMPKKFDPEAGSIKEKAKVTSEQAFNWLVNTDDRNAASLGLRTPEGDVVLRRLFNGGFELEMPKAVSKGKKYWGNPSMVEIIGEQAVKGNGKLNIRLSKDDAMAVNKVMTNINPLTITNQVQIADYNKMTGKKVPTFSETNIKFSKVPLNAAEKSGKGMTKPEAELAAKEWLRQFKTDIGVKVVRNQAEFNQMLEDMGQSAVNADEVANAAYIPESKTLLLNASAIQNPARLRQLMRHEILGHHGLEYVIGKGAVNDILQILKNGYNTSKAIRDAVDTVAANYADADVKTKIKEAFAHYAENRPVDKGAIGRLWDRVVDLVKSALVKAGFIKPNEAEQQLDSLLKTIAEQMRNGTTNNDPNGGPGKKTYFSKAVTDDEIRMAKLGLGPKPSFTDKTKAQLEQLRKADKSTVKAWLDQLKRKANTQILDALAPIKYAEEQAGKLDASDSGYVAARLASGSASVMQATMMYGIPQWKDGVIQRKEGTNEKDALLGIFEELGPDLHNWLAWMAGHRGEILKSEGRENLFTDKDIAEYKAKGLGKEAKFMAAKQKWNKLNGAILDLAQEAGLFSAEDRTKFESEWYVPFFRESDDGDVMGPYKKNGIANQSSGMKTLKGGTANINDMLENIFQTTSKLIDSSMKNMAAQKVVYNLADTDLIEVVTKPNMLDIKAAVQNKQNLMIVKMEGENYLIRVNDPDLFRAMTMIDGTVERDPFRKAAMKAKHILTAGITASPDFMLRNFLRDAASTWAINEDGFKPMIDSIRGVKKAWQMDDSSVDMMFSGASFMGGNLRGTDPEAMASVIRKTLRRKGMSPEQISKYENSLITNGRKAKDVLLSAWEKYEKAGEAVENGSREAVYEAAIKAGKSHAQAAFEAKDLMDFSMLGSSKIMRYMVDVLPFFNARMQGLGKLGRAVAANPKQIARRGGMIAAASLALLALNWDDDRYNDLPDWDKDLNWHFWLGDEHFRIPKPFEVGLMFGTLPERMIRTMGGKDTAGKFGQVVARNILETFSVNPIPQVVKPLTESYFNYDMFRGAPIENMSDLNVAPEARYDERTSLLMRELGQITGLSPKKLEHIVTGYTGTIGAYVMGAGDAIVRASGDYGAAPAIRADQIPVLKSIYQGSAPAKSSQAMTDFYQLLDEANQVYSTIRQYQKEGRMGDAQEMLEENRNKLAGRKTMTNAQKQFRQIRNEMELIQRDRNLNSDEKRERIDRLLSKRNNFAAKLIKRFGTEL